jgi:hypothetical protein
LHVECQRFCSWRSLLWELWIIDEAAYNQSVPR